MPKRNPLSRVKSAPLGEDNVNSPSWHSQVMASLKNKFRRNRTGSVDADLLPDISMRGKYATLPARVTTQNRREEGDKPHTPYLMVEVDELEDSLNGDAVKNDSDGSVDSGFHPKHMDVTSSLKRGSAVISKSSLGRASTYYDKDTVEKAFGSMKDIGRWYTSYSHHLSEEDDRYIHRPMVPIPLQVCGEEEQCTAARPLPPLPPPSTVPAVPVRPLPARRLNEEMLYEQVQHKMLGSNGLTLNLRNLAQYGWYWGPITRVEAEERLSGAKDGTFLVRDSSDDRYLLSLSFHSQAKTLHTRIEYCNGNFSFYSFPDAESEGYSSVVELIQRSMQYSKNGVFCFSRARAAGSPAVPVRLIKPFSRFKHVQTLQHHCRFVIRQSIRFDKIRQLPLPRHVHGYLEQSQF